MRSFRPPGGERSGREPWRSAAAIHWAAGQRWRDCPDADNLAYSAWQQGLNCPETTAVGRLFDAASALICGMLRTSFEAQGPMCLESLCAGEGEVTPLPLEEGADGILRTDWAPLLSMMVDDRRTPAERSAAFHSSMAEALRAQARRVREMHKVDQVGLAGGVFQNRVLTDQVFRLLVADGFDVYLNQLLPCNDAALSFGQAAECAAGVTLKEA
jgi:hydrogenase maturation protein HypF